MHNTIPSNDWVKVAVGATTLSLFFIPTPNTGSSIWLAELWNIGHVVWFALATRLLAPRLNLLIQPPLKASLALALLMLMAGSAIELIQSITQREASLHDLILDMVGTYIGVLLFQPFRQAWLTFPNKLAAITTFACLYPLWPFSVLILDNAIAQRQFPTLLNFSTPFEQIRVSGSTALERQDDQLMVTFTPAPFSTLHIQRFHSDWRDYEYLQIECHLEGKRPLRLQVSIEDAPHTENHHRLSDRFTRIYALQPGFNRLTVLLSDMTSAPNTRLMDLTQITKISMYTSQLDTTRSLILKKVYLHRTD